MENTEILRSVRCIIRLFETSEQPICRERGLSPAEVDILAFLANNPGLDTATDIVELRMLPKANVSQAVEAMIGKGLLTRRQDTGDRRRIHLALTAEAETVLPAIRAARASFFQKLFAGFSPEELEVYARLSTRIAGNALSAIGGKGAGHAAG